MESNKYDKSPLPCRRCGKNMLSNQGKGLIGLSIILHDEQSDPEYSSFLKEQMGDLIVGEDYSFCFECFIKAILFSKY